MTDSLCRVYWLLTFCCLVCHNVVKSTPSRPNIVFILADDLGKIIYKVLFAFHVVLYSNFKGFNDVPWNNPHLVAPHLKSLSARSTVIHNYYSYYACNPSRASLMTGYYHLNTHMLGLNTLKPAGLTTQHNLMPQYFKQLGYKTHMMGK